ncbi:MAG: DUF1830 domain-containing protein [Geitlerinemataceae cyanobacterium]
MAQILDSLPKDSRSAVLCCYVNATNQIQVSRITNVPNWYFERVVFPGQRLMFEAPPGAQIEIHSGMMASAILSDTIPCDRLRVDSPAVGGEPMGRVLPVAPQPETREPVLASSKQTA